MAEAKKRVMINTSVPMADSLWISNPLNEEQVVSFLNAFQNMQLPKGYKFKNPNLLMLHCYVLNASTLEEVDYFGRHEYRRQGDAMIYVSPY